MGQYGLNILLCLALHICCGLQLGVRQKRRDRSGDQLQTPQGGVQGCSNHELEGGPDLAPWECWDGFLDRDQGVSGGAAGVHYVEILTAVECLCLSVPPQLETVKVGADTKPGRLTGICPLPAPRLSEGVELLACLLCRLSPISGPCQTRRSGSGSKASSPKQNGVCALQQRSVRVGSHGAARLR